MSAIPSIRSPIALRRRARSWALSSAEASTTKPALNVLNNAPATKQIAKVMPALGSIVALRITAQRPDSIPEIIGIRTRSGKF